VYHNKSIQYIKKKKVQGKPRVYTWLNIKKYKNKIKNKHAFNTNIIIKKYQYVY
jgi:hypothetical protein